MNLKTIFAKKEKRPSAAAKNKEERSQLLLREYDRVFRLFREHSSISIREVLGVPPEKYRVVYQVDGLVQTGKSIESKSEHIVELFLPNNFPDEPPAATMPLPAYHPNISAEMIDVRGLWKQSPTLADCIVGIGEMIVFQRYSTEQPLNGEAAQWALRNKSLLPLSSVDLHYRVIEAAPMPAADSTAVSLEQPTEKIVNEGKTRAIAVGDDTDQIDIERELAAEPLETLQVPSDIAVAETSTAGATREAIRIDTPTVEIPRASGFLSDGKVEPEKSGSRTNRETDAPRETVGVKTDRVKASPVAMGSASHQGPSHMEVNYSQPHEKQTGQLSTSDKKLKGKKEKHEVVPLPPERVSSGMNNPDGPSGPLSPKPDTPLKIDDRITSPVLSSKGGGYCPNCGGKTDGSANFCVRCGTRLTTKSSQRIAKLFFIASMIAIPIVIIEMGAIIILLKKEGPEPKAMTEMSQRVAPPGQPEAAALTPALQGQSTVNEAQPVSVAKKDSSTTLAVTASPGENPVASTSKLLTKEKASVSGISPAKKKQKAVKETELSDEDAAVLFSQPLPHSGSMKSSSASVADNLKLARLYMGIGSYDDAINRFNDVLAADPSNKEALAGLEKAKGMKPR